MTRSYNVSTGNETSNPEHHTDSNGNALTGVGLQTGPPEIHIEPIDEEEEDDVDTDSKRNTPQITVSSYEDHGKPKDTLPTPDLHIDSDSDYEIHPGVTKPSEYKKSNSLDYNDPKPPRPDVEKVDTRCGCGKCHPSCLQKGCNNPKAFLFWLSLFALVQGFVVNGINNVNVTTLEKRYDFQSSEMGFVISAYDISAGILVLPITYYGAYAHQPRMLAVSALIMAAGSFVMALPQFLAPPYDIGEAGSSVCDISGNKTILETVVSNLRPYIGVFAVGQVLHGVGGCVLFSLGFVFMDSNVSNKASPIYIAIVNMCATLGPAVGYLLGGKIIDIFYVDIYRATVPDDMTATDPRWVGAWWICFLISSSLAVIVFAGIIPYPKQLPQYEAVQKERTSQAHHDGNEELAEQEGFGQSIKDLPIAAKILLCNPTNMFITLGGCFEGIIIAGFAVFMPKFIQNQYNQSAGQAAFLGGAVAVPGAAGGQIIGGVIVRLLDLKVKGILKLLIILCVLFPIPLLAVLFLGCDFAGVAGVNRHYPNGTGGAYLGDDYSIISPCNSACNCTTASYQPVCGGSNVQFFSPCHAGCFTKGKHPNDSEITIYTNCSCMVPPSGWNPREPLVKDKECSSNCDQLTWFLVTFLFDTIFTFMIQIPALTASLRCIPDSQRSFGMGIKWCFIRFLGTVPGPIIFGAIFDSTCTLWGDNGSGQGSCWIYDNYNLAFKLFFTFLGLKAGTLLFFVLALCFYQPPLDEEDLADLEEVERESIEGYLGPGDVHESPPDGKHSLTVPSETLPPTGTEGRRDSVEWDEKRRGSLEWDPHTEKRRGSMEWDPHTEKRRGSMDWDHKPMKKKWGSLEWDPKEINRRRSIEWEAKRRRKSRDWDSEKRGSREWGGSHHGSMEWDHKHHTNRKTSIVQALAGSAGAQLYPGRTESRPTSLEMGSRRSSGVSSITGGRKLSMAQILVGKLSGSSDLLNVPKDDSRRSSEPDIRRHAIKREAGKAKDAAMYTNRAYEGNLDEHQYDKTL